jgi:hypothetical protein
MTAGPAKNGDPKGGVLINPLERSEELTAQSIGQGVELLRAIQRQPSHAPGEAFFLDEGVAHGPSA